MPLLCYEGQRQKDERIDTLVIIAELLNTTVDYLLTGRNVVACDKREYIKR